MPADEPLLRVEGLVKAFAGQRALDGANLEVRAGEVHALLGENGAGKSTLIRCITGIHQPDAGTVTIDGEPVDLHDVRHASRAGICAIHQQANLVPTLSIADNLAMGRRFAGRLGPLVRPSWQRAAAAELLTRVDLNIDPRTLVAKLRPHEAAMVAIARALAADARLIILDEPTTALSAVETDTLFGQIERLVADGVAVIYVSHRLAEVFRLADRVTVLRNGRTVASWDELEGRQESIVDAIVGEMRARHTERLVDHRRDEVRLSVEHLAAGTASDVSFAVRAGEVLGLAGLAGSGADEVASALFANPRPRAGSVRVNGQAVKISSPRGAKRAGIAMVPKDRHAEALLPTFSVRENVTLASTDKFISDPVLRWMRRGPECAEVDKVMVALHVKASSVEQDVATLSGGNQQKVVIGRWITEPYEVYVFVDPCAGVDVGAKAEIYAIIRDLAAKGAAVVFTSSEPEEYERVCDRVLVMRSGEVTDELAGPDICDTTIVRRSLGLEKATHPQPVTRAADTRRHTVGGRL